GPLAPFIYSSQQVLVSWAGSLASAQDEISAFHIDKQTNVSVTLMWEPPDQNYTVTWAEDDQPLGTKDASETQHSVEALQPGTTYEFPARAEGHSSGRSPRASTGELWPCPGGREHWVSWTRDGAPSQEASTGADQYQAQLLEPGSLYEFAVRSMLHAVNSSAQMLFVFTEPNEVRNLEVVRQTNNSIAFNWTAPEGPTSPTYRVSWFSSESQERYNFTDGTNFTAEGLTPGTWYQFLVRSETKDGAQSPQRAVNASTAPDPVAITSCTSSDAGYGLVLTLACPAGNQEDLEFEVGTHRGTWSGHCTSPKFVGGLQPARSYTATVTSLWAGLSAISAPVTCHTESGGVIAGTVVGVLIFILLLGLLIFLRRLQRHRKSVQEKPQTSGVAFSSLGGIPAENLAAYIMEKEKDSNYGFAEEYQQLSLEGTGQMQTAASALENKSKNRFSNVLPYDWSRVPLQPMPGDPSSDYINASFIPGLIDPREYIATQGPLPQTVGDFWRLVWDQQSRTIVMLTNCVESGRVKCEHYWPLDAKPCSHGNLRVTLKGEHVTEHWTIRDLQLFHMELKEDLSVRQFHYTVWPDHGVPRSPDPLLAFQALLRKWLDQSLGGGPPIVHCSAGVGRTGTLIALDVLLKQLQKYQQVGVQSFIRRMRKSRPLMVQTEGQYIFLYQTLLRYLQLSQDSGDDEREEEAVLYENLEAIQAYEREIGVR
ncbi:receptor-type tyrosine-protein phosphatase H, partial [Petaurus breviceps papuanus]|uniref:receptor-type tyrosine-protein phosphatase H n=1 Tax=Petaurus breviceps papuanus TaxID=3040969 RepID=UPI0036DACF68